MRYLDACSLRTCLRKRQLWPYPAVQDALTSAALRAAELQLVRRAPKTMEEKLRWAGGCGCCEGGNRFTYTYGPFPPFQ